MASINDGESKPAGTLLKYNTAVFGLMYVLGILVINIQSANVGISDFNSLQARNVLVGVQFIVFFAFLSSIPLSLVLFIHWIRLFDLSSVLLFVLLLLIGSFIILAFLCLFLGTIYGYMYPWGLSWASVVDLHAYSLRRQQDAYIYFSDTFVHPKTVTAAVVLMVVFLLAYICENIYVYTSLKPYLRRYVPPYLLLTAAVSIWLLLFDFSYYVYPNIPYNYGGGQPNIVKLHIQTSDRKLLCFMGLRIISEDKDTVTTEPLVLWYRDHEFFYVSPFREEHATSPLVLEIGTDLVHAVQHIQGYARIGHGAGIRELHLDN